MRLRFNTIILSLLPLASNAFAFGIPAIRLEQHSTSLFVADNIQNLDQPDENSEGDITREETTLDPIEPTTTESFDEKSKIVQDILLIASATDRGQFATQTQKTQVEDSITKLESLYSSSSEQGPTLSSSITGTWDLLYSNTQLFRSSPFFMAGRAVCQTEAEAKQYDWFCDMHRAALAISNISTVRQIISDTGRMTSEFEVKVGSVPFLSDFTPFKYSGGLPFTIDGAIVSSADVTPTDDGKGWEIFMDTVEIKGSNIPLLRQALDGYIKLKSRDLGSFLEENVAGYTNPKPIFETTYLDESIRISRDQDGKIFVYGKSSDDMTPTDYSRVDSDLGVLNLLQGMNDSIFKFYI